MPVSETLWDSYLEGQLPYCRASVVIGAKPIWGGQDRNLGGATAPLAPCWLRPCWLTCLGKKIIGSEVNVKEWSNVDI